MKPLFGPNEQVLVRSPDSDRMIVGMVTGRTESYNKDREGRMVVYTVRYEGRQYERHDSPFGESAWELTYQYTSSKFDEEYVFPLPRQMGLFGEIGDYHTPYNVFGNSDVADAMRYATREMLISVKDSIPIGSMRRIADLGECSIGIDWAESEEENNEKV